MKKGLCILFWVLFALVGPVLFALVGPCAVAFAQQPDCLQFRSCP